MSLPTTFDFAQLKLGDGATPENFVIVCGLETTGINESAQTSDRYVRDCAAPATPPRRRLRVTGVTWDISGNGMANVDQFALLKAALGKHRNWEIVPLDTTDPDTPAGVPMGTFSGQAVMTARNIGTVADGFATLELALAGEGDLDWVAEA
ncbi:hypothetical protein IL54_4836 [Sphingobium sp. ba1]|jgi:predicted secreted protein|uniref:phage tail tube protein n=1 Tax=Sphingobium sp. ba1 TaxID=1522072 RepID=UPI00068D89E4|nr:phage tail tube protein [Sphingobium sp. ba1]OMG61405.1 hypothetical protein IL54_4836 [Sphingobium sp. ba1]